MAIPPLRFVSSCLRAFVPLLLASCASDRGPEYVWITSGDYHKAFEAAIEVGRAHGLPPALRDRRRGVIETEPRIASSVLDFWRGENTSLGQSLENTIAFQRHRARFEFTPAGSPPDPPAGEPATDGPDVFATVPALDLTEYEGPLELRVTVVVERAHQPGVRRSTWTRRLTTQARIVSAQTGFQRLPSGWAPVARDPAFERRLLAAVDDHVTRLGDPGAVR